MNDDIAATIEAVTGDSMIETHVEAVKDLGDRLGVRHDGDTMGKRWIVDAAEDHDLSVAVDDEDANMVVFA